MTLRANYHPEVIVPSVVLIKKGIKVTIGFPGASGVDYVYTSVADMAEQTLEIVDIIPSMCKLISCMVRCTSNCNVNMQTSVGKTSGASDVLNSAYNDDLNDILSSESNIPLVLFDMSPKSLFINSTPTSNWDTMTSGLWEINILYIDYSLV